MPGPIPTIYGTQIGLKRPWQVDALKAALRSGTFRFDEPDNWITGIRVSGNVYYVKEGHHRLVAALELYGETGDPTIVLQLIAHGKWADRDYPPNDARPMPARSWWPAFRNWLGW